MILVKYIPYREEGSGRAWAALRGRREGPWNISGPGGVTAVRSAMPCWGPPCCWCWPPSRFPLGDPVGGFPRRGGPVTRPWLAAGDGARGRAGGGRAAAGRGGRWGRCCLRGMARRVWGHVWTVLALALLVIRLFQRLRGGDPGRAGDPATGSCIPTSATPTLILDFDPVRPSPPFPGGGCWWRAILGFLLGARLLSAPCSNGGGVAGGSWWWGLS